MTALADRRHGRAKLAGWHGRGWRADGAAGRGWLALADGPGRRTLAQARAGEAGAGTDVERVDRRGEADTGPAGRRRLRQAGQADRRHADAKPNKSICG